MKKLSKKLQLLGLLALTLSVALLSFTSPKGGEGFEIYLNNKLITQQYGKDVNTVKMIAIDESQADVQLTVKYWHCGQEGKNRILTVKDVNNKLLKQWRFADAGKNNSSMCCGAKEILSLKTKNTGTLNLYYSSSQLPNGRLLATIALTNQKSIARR